MRKSTLISRIRAVPLPLVAVLLFSAIASTAASASCPNPNTWPETVSASRDGAGVVSVTLGQPVFYAFLSPSITRVDRVVIIDGNSNGPCGIGTPPPPRLQTYVLGVLEPGAYTLRAIHRGYAGGPFVVERPFVVEGVAGAMSVPATGGPALWVLVIAFAALAVGVSMRARR